MDLFGPQILEYTNIEKHVQDLQKEVHFKVPESKCLGCPSRGGIGHEVVADCCRKASPPLYYIEFVNVYKYIKQSWSKIQIEELFYYAFETLFNSNDEKPCVLLNQLTNECRVYKHRWLNCRTYGMVPDSEWEIRARFWVKDVLKPKFTVQKTVKEMVESGLTGISGKKMKIEKEVVKNVVDEESLDKYLDELFSDEEFNPEKINQKIIEDYGVRPLLYNQCKNIKIDKPHFGLNKLYEKLVEIESSFIKTDIKKLPENQTYMAFHIYLLLFVLGEEKLETLISYGEKASAEQKELFLKDIKKNLGSLVEDFCE